MTETTLQDLALIAGLVTLNGVFVAGEFALVRSNPQQLKGADNRRKIGIRAAVRLLDEMDLSLSTTQFGITLCSILLGWQGTKSLTPIFRELIAGLGYPMQTRAEAGLPLILALICLVVLHVVFGELTAKSFAIRFPEFTLRMLGGFLRAVSLLCRPFLFVITRSTESMLRLVGIHRSAHLDRVHSLAELSFLVSKSTEGGLLDREEEQMVRGVFGLSETVAREIMTPRTDVVMIAADASLDEVLNTIRESGLSRFPVSGDSIDDVIGVLLARDILSFVVPGVLYEERRREDFRVKKLMREPYFVQGTKRIDELLSEFKMRKLHLALVLDEHGGIDGVVTLEDLLEEIVGDIFDETDIPERTISVADNGDVLIDGGQLVADLNTRFHLEIPEGDYDTIAGFIFTALGRMPKPGDRILVNRVEHSHSAAASDEPPMLGGASELMTPPEGEELVVASDGEGNPGEAERQPQALLTVERVQSYRIEMVRLTPFYVPPESESSLPGGSSKAVSSNSEVDA